MTGMVLLVCCGLTVLLCVPVQAYGKVDIYFSMNKIMLCYYIYLLLFHMIVSWRLDAVLSTPT